MSEINHNESHVKTLPIDYNLVAACNFYLWKDDVDCEGALLPRYTTDELLTKITQDLNEPDIAEFVQEIIDEASTPEDGYRIVEAVFSILDAIKTAQSLQP